MILVQCAVSASVHLVVKGSVTVNSGVDAAWVGDVQRGRVGGVHGGAACFHWCRSHTQATLVVGRRSANLEVREQGENDSMGTGHDGWVVCVGLQGIGIEDSTSHWATRGRRNIKVRTAPRPSLQTSAKTSGGKYKASNFVKLENEGENRVFFYMFSFYMFGLVGLSSKPICRQIGAAKEMTRKWTREQRREHSQGRLPMWEN